MQTKTLKPDKNGINAAAELLRGGKTVAFATETVYGLGADACNDAAVAGIFKAKDRPDFNPLIVHLADLDMLNGLAEIPDAAKKLLPLWPGPLTLVLPKKPNSGLSDLVTAGLDTVAIRVPAHPSAQALLQAFGGPVAAPSANPSGKVSATNAGHVLAGLQGKIAAVLDAGPCGVGVESTIIGFADDQMVLLRPGGIDIETIKRLTGQVPVAAKTNLIIAPGQMQSHYAPDVALRMNANKPQPDEAWLGFGANPRIAPGLNLSPTGDLTEAAIRLFDSLRKMDAICKSNGFAGFAVAPIPDTGLGLAINDRLQRASAPRHNR